MDPRFERTFRPDALLRAGGAIFAILAAGLIAFLVAAHVEQLDPGKVRPVAPPVASAPTPTPSPLTDLGRALLGSVVTIEAELPTEESLGTGWIFDTRGDVVTNAHVVECHLAIRITDRLGHAHVAAVVRSDTASDIALLRPAGVLTGTPLPIDTTAIAQTPMGVITLASSRATGHADMTVETLIGLHDDVPLANGRGGCADQPAPSVYDDMLHLQGASIFEGNSGGPVVDGAGRVVGIMTLASPSAPDAYAIPISRVLSTLTAWAHSG